MNTILYDYVCEELEDVERDGLKAGNLDSTDKLVNIKKNLLKIEKYESEMDGGYSMGDGYWEAQGSYAGEPIPSTTMIVTPAAVGDFFNVSRAVFIDVPCGCCVTIAVENTSTTDAGVAIPIDVANANIVVERVA